MQTWKGLDEKTKKIKIILKEAERFSELSMCSSVNLRNMDFWKLVYGFLESKGEIFDVEAIKGKGMSE